MTADRRNWKPLPQPLKAAVKKFDEWARADLMSADVTRKVEAPLYHYTDAAGLEGIIKRQEIWLTSYTHLNDPSEIKYGMSIARDLFGEIGESNDELIKLFCDMMNDLFTHDNMSGAFGFFIGSFSRDRDDLGQWRAYGDNGKGFALGLSPSLFQATDKVRKRATENVIVVPVVYGKEEGRQHHMQPIETALRIVGETIESNYDTFHDSSVGMPFFEKVAKALIASHMILNSLTIKHEAYRHEREVRLIILGQHKKILRDVSTRARRGDIVPFIKMAVQSKGNIVEIVIGPSAEGSAESGLESLLHPFHGDPSSIIRRSEIPYRGT